MKRPIIVVFLSLLLFSIFGIVSAKPRDLVEIQFLNISDWHAQLDPLFIFPVGSFGGAAELSTYFQMERAANPNTLTLTAGDAYGGSPPLSNFFDEVPAVLSMNLMGFDVDTFGNHNFDGGIAHLNQMIALADFPYVSANLENRDDNLTGAEDYQIFDVGGVKVGVIGVTNPEAPTLVFPGNFGTIVPTDPIPAANKAKAAAKSDGAKILVAITHLGVAGFDADGNAFGPLIDFANNVGGFDLIIGDHTNVEYSGIHGKALVVENLSKGVTYARIQMTVDPQNGRVIVRSVDFVPAVSSAVIPDPAIEALLQPFRDQLDDLLNVVVGKSTVMIPRADACGTGNGRTCESLVGNSTTDSMRMRYGADFAITNAGGLRADLTCPIVDSPTDFCPPFSGPNFDITAGQVLTVLPFGNQVVTYDLNGAELKDMLENGVSRMPGISGRFAQVSGLCFTYDIDASAGSRVSSAVRQAEDGSCTGDAVDLTAGSIYSVSSNDFMASGGDGYPDFTARMTSRELMDQVLSEYVTDNSPISPTIQGRINCVGSTCPALLP